MHKINTAPTQSTPLTGRRGAQRRCARHDAVARGQHRAAAAAAAQTARAAVGAAAGARRGHRRAERAGLAGGIGAGRRCVKDSERERRGLGVLLAALLGRAVHRERAAALGRQRRRQCAGRVGAAQGCSRKAGVSEIRECVGVEVARKGTTPNVFLESTIKKNEIQYGRWQRTQLWRRVGSG